MRSWVVVAGIAAGSIGADLAAAPHEDAAPSAAGPDRAPADVVDADAGVGFAWFATPHDHDDHVRVLATFALGVGTDLQPDLHVALRGRVSIGDGSFAVLGPTLRHRFDSFFISYGPAIASVLGPDAMPGRPRGIGLAADLRAGARRGDFTIVLHALPIWVFASDSPVFEAELHDAVELGISLGIVR